MSKRHPARTLLPFTLEPPSTPSRECRSLGDVEWPLSQVTLSRDIYQAFIFPAPFERSKRSKDSPGKGRSWCRFLLRDPIGTFRDQTSVFASAGATSEAETVNREDHGVCVLAESSRLHNAVGTAWLPMRRVAARIKLRLARK